MPELSELTIQLKDGEQDVQNAFFHEALRGAWRIVSTHPMFRGIQEANPLPLGEGGSQAPFNQGGETHIKRKN